MRESCECKTCGVIAKNSADICNPYGIDISCRDSEETQTDATEILCDPMEQMKLFSCEACGGISPDATLLCIPMPLESEKDG